MDISAIFVDRMVCLRNFTGNAAMDIDKVTTTKYSIIDVFDVDNRSNEKPNIQKYKVIFERDSK